MVTSQVLSQAWSCTSSHRLGQVLYPSGLWLPWLNLADLKLLPALVIPRSMTSDSGLVTPLRGFCEAPHHPYFSVCSAHPLSEYQLSTCSVRPWAHTESKTDRCLTSRPHRRHKMHRRTEKYHTLGCMCSRRELDLSHSLSGAGEHNVTF